jgi:hypothetical protein
MIFTQKIDDHVATVVQAMDSLQKDNPKLGMSAGAQMQPVVGA